MPENLGVIDATPKPGIEGLTITLKAGDEELEVELIERWPNVLKLRIGYLNVDDVFQILELLIANKPVPLPEGVTLKEEERLRTHQEMFRLWYIKTDADDRLLVESIDMACRRLNNGRPLADVAPLLALSLLPEPGGLGDSGVNTVDLTSTILNGEPSSTASTKPSGETNSTDSKTNGSEPSNTSPPSTSPKLTKQSTTI